MPLGPQPDVPAVVHFVMRGTKGGTSWANKGYLQYSGPAPAVADLATVGTAIANAWNTDFAPICPAGVVLTTIDLQDLTSRLAARNSVTVSHAGTRTGTEMPNQVALVISWLINRRYRGGHPRTYLPAGVLEDVTSARLWAGAFVTAAQAAATAFRTALNAISVSGATYKMAAVNMVTHDATTHALEYVVPPNVFTVQGNAVHGRVDTVRRRLGRETA